MIRHSDYDTLSLIDQTDHANLSWPVSWTIGKARRIPQSSIVSRTWSRYQGASKPPDILPDPFLSFSLATHNKLRTRYREMYKKICSIIIQVIESLKLYKIFKISFVSIFFLGFRSEKYVSLIFWFLHLKLIKLWSYEVILFDSKTKKFKRILFILKKAKEIIKRS